MDKLKEIIKKLRDPKTGCPWDKQQTHQSLTPYVIEEAYEVVEAIESGKDYLLVDELGDLLLQVVLHARIAEERGAFCLEDVINAVSNKLIRRHPHVFGEIKADNVEQVWRNWEQIKQQEKKQLTEGQSVLADIPKSMPGLIQAEKVQKKVSRLGFDWANPQDVLDKLVEEVAEFQRAKNSEQKQEEMGDIFFTLVNIARKQKINAEEALRKSTNKFIDRFQKVEKIINDQQKTFTDFTLEQLENLWRQVKKLK